MCIDSTGMIIAIVLSLLALLSKLSRCIDSTGMIIAIVLSLLALLSKLCV